jgi:hypothetical protein
MGMSGLPSSPFHHFRHDSFTLAQRDASKSMGMFYTNTMALSVFVGNIVKAGINIRSSDFPVEASRRAALHLNPGDRKCRSSRGNRR